MPPKKKSGPSFRNSSYNAPKPKKANANNNNNNNNKKRNKSGLANAGRNPNFRGKGHHPQHHNKKMLAMRRDTAIREQPNEYIIMIHAELALPCPMQQVADNAAAENVPSHLLRQQLEERSQTGERAFDPKQIVQLGFCVLHTPSGSVCGRLQSLVRPPPAAAPLSRYCCDTIGGVTQEDVDAALPLVDVMRRAEVWIRDVLAGRGTAPEGEEEQFVVELSKKIDRRQQPSDDEEDEEEEAGEEGEEEEEGEEGEQEVAADDGSAAAALPATRHTIVLASDGLPTIAAIFQGQQQYMPPLEEQQEQQEASSTTAFSYLNTLGADIFDRWIDVREHFHRYFRVPSSIRLKFNDQLREIGLTYTGKGHHAADKTLNMAHLMVAMMKKGCVFQFAFQCRGKHEQHKEKGSAVGTVLVGGDDGNGSGANNKQQQEPKRTTRDFISNTADMAMLRDPGQGPLSLPTSSSSSSPLMAIIGSEVFVRWLLFFVLLCGIVWNLGTKGVAAKLMDKFVVKSE